MSIGVQAAGVLSLVSIPLVLGLLAWGLTYASVGLGVAVGLAFVVGLQAAVARRWTLSPRALAPGREPELRALIERIATMADLSVPRIVLHEKPYANSWITGLTNKQARLHLTRGLLDLLNEQQLGAVVAHEFAHIRQRDAVLMSLAGTPVAALADGSAVYFDCLTQMQRLWRRRRVVLSSPHATDEQRANDGELVAEFIGIWAFAWLFCFPFALLFFVVGSVCRTVTAVFSRARELEADAAAALLTGNPAALSSALIALDSTRGTLVPSTDLRNAASLDVFHIIAMRHEPPLLHTHPSLKRRLDQLAAIEARLQHS